MRVCVLFFFFFQAEDGIRDLTVTGVQTCALPICPLLHASKARLHVVAAIQARMGSTRLPGKVLVSRSEEHTSELQSQSNLVCRLLLEKKKQWQQNKTYMRHACCPCARVP